MTRYMYSAVAALIYSTVSDLVEAGISLDPYHWEPVPEEFCSLVQSGGKECWER